MLSKEEIKITKTEYIELLEIKDRYNEIKQQRNDFIGIIIDKISRGKITTNQARELLGFSQKQNEAMQICKQCKYIKKLRQLETKHQKLIEKLEEDITNFAKENRDGSLQDYVDEILGILKGENDE